MTQADNYAHKLIGHISEIFNPDSDYFIDKDDFQEGDNATDFIHALANLMPAMVYQGITGEAADILSFNHIANRLVFQYTKGATETK